MPETAEAPLRSTAELHSCEPKDKRTKEWREWHEEFEAAIQREMNVPPPPSSSPSAAPPAPTSPQNTPSSAAPAAKVYGEPKNLMTPDEFLFEFFRHEPAAVLAAADLPNSAASLASSVEKSYTAYLLLVSPRFNAKYRKRVASGEITLMGQHLPRVGILQDLHDDATGK